METSQREDTKIIGSVQQEGFAASETVLQGGNVFVKPRPGNKHQPWIYGEVIGSTAPSSCTVNTSTGPVRRNHTQIREAKAEPEDKLQDRLETVSLPESELTETDQPVEQEPTPQSDLEPIPMSRH